MALLLHRNVYRLLQLEWDIKSDNHENGEERKTLCFVCVCEKKGGRSKQAVEVVAAARQRMYSVGKSKSGRDTELKKANRTILGFLFGEKATERRKGLDVISENE